MTQYSQCFVEVNLAKQPVLFKMLVELGHGPRRNEDGDLAVRVKEDRHRKPEEVVAALSQPRKPKEVKEVKEEGYPSVGRPRPQCRRRNSPSRGGLLPNSVPTWTGC
ncbi:unnamed protein product [Durusdinium trenchii]|uniref:Uncharacterized protein n=1 Tax=Durusdinium trenchii TaxID=1381693 RepID=A0ABP0MWQ6_9DINO